MNTGDRVRVLDAVYGTDFPVGAEGVVVDHHLGYFLYVRLDDYTYPYEQDDLLDPEHRNTWAITADEVELVSEVAA